MWANVLIDRLLDTQVEVEAETLGVKQWAVKAEALIHSVTFPQQKAQAKRLRDTWAMRRPRQWST